MFFYKQIVVNFEFKNSNSCVQNEDIKKKETLDQNDSFITFDQPLYLKHRTILAVTILKMIFLEFEMLCGFQTVISV